MWNARQLREENAAEYEHRTNVHYLPGSWARRQAALNARALEDDRRSTLKADLIRQRRELLEKVGGIDAMLLDLEGG